MPVPPRKPRRWQEDKHFCEWLLSFEYAAEAEKPGPPVPHLSSGVVLHMWEAWTSGRRHAFRGGAEDGSVYVDV